MDPSVAAEIETTLHATPEYEGDNKTTGWPAPDVIPPPYVCPAENIFPYSKPNGGTTKFN
ncbi:hypothetical protein [Novipirellula sp.]|uniref:hypothetical protein n=1 Tax=Novipirellula sp. TaxID=2795430 RepID=UPI003562EBD8